MSPNRLDHADKQSLRAYWTFFAPFRAAILEEIQREAPDNSDVAKLTRDEAEDWRLEHLAINADAWAPFLERLRERGNDYARSEMPYAVWFRHLSKLRDRSLHILGEHLTGPASHVVSRGALLAFDINLEMIGRAYFEAKEQASRRHDHEFQVMFRDNPNAMWTVDPDTGQLRSVNAAAIAAFGYTREELLAMTLADLGISGDATGVHTLRRKDGTTSSVELSSSLLAASLPPVRLVTAIDVTSREQARAALRRSEELLQHSQKMDALGRLAGGVAHDFNNILTVVQSYACMLEEALDEGDVRRQDAMEIRRASDRATKLTRQLLTLSRQSPAVAKPTSLDELIAGFTPALRRLLGSGIQLDVRRGTTPLVIADPAQLEQVVMNLAVNARDAMEAKGRLTVETTVEDLDPEAAALHRLAPGRHVVLAVSDTGSGIPPEVRARIFDPFFTTKEAGKGTGLGLSIVHGIVTQAGGAIDVYSERGHGTTFRIRLPAQAEANAAEVEAAPKVVRELRPVTVLFVDAQAELRTLASRVLGAAGCTVVEAATGDEARRACVTHDGTIDVAVIDLALADERGDLLVRALRELRPAIRVILMSGFPSSTLAPSGDAPSELLVKPFTPGQLRAAIANATSDDEPAIRTSEANLAARVLIADDDPSLRKMLSRLLRRAAFDVVEADSGRAALAELADKRIDVILSDIHMPEGDGIELLRGVRRVDLDVPVILMSGKPDVATAATALEHGAYRYLTKPLGTETVEKLVRQAARAHALARLRREAATVAGTNAGAGDRAGLEVRFDQALDRLFMAFQPIVRAHDRALFGVEALMRSEEPSLSRPGPILDAAAQLGRMPALGRRTRMLAGRAIADSAIPALFINLHPIDLLDVDLIDERSPLAQIASRVVLEVTERESLVTSTALTERLDRLRELGFRLAVDDIGAGYSGLTSFTDLTPEIVKIDMSLVRSIHTSVVKQRTVGALCKLCHEIGTLVVGEGVETEDEERCLIDLGCDLLQGYLIASPKRELPQA